MKILKKILPLASIASVAAVAAPLATSCSTGTASVGTYTFSYDVEDTAGLTKYEPKFTPAPQQGAESISSSVGRTLYFNKLDSDHSLLSDDYLCGLNAYMINLFPKIVDENYSLKKLNGSSDLTINSIEPYSVNPMQNEEKIELRKVSFTIQLKLDYTLATKNAEGEEVEKVGSITQKFEFKNFTLDVKGDGSEQSYVYFDNSYTKDWELTFSSSTSFDGSSQSGSITWDKENWKSSTLATRFIPVLGVTTKLDFTMMVQPTSIRFDYVAYLFSQIAQMCLNDDEIAIQRTHYLMNNVIGK